MLEFYELESEYIECDCSNELLQLTAENPEIINDNEIIDFIYISFYEQGHRRDNRFLWKTRLKHIWYIIRYGTPWKDQIVLRTNERLKLMNWLNKVEEKRIELEKNINLNFLIKEKINDR